MEAQMVLGQVTQLIAFGYMFFAGLVLIFMLIQIFAFYLSGRATGSIDDEVGSAFTLFGAMLIIGAASTLLNAMVATFLGDMLIAGAVAFLAYLIAIVYAVVRIYELSIGKAILFLLLSMVITIVLTGAMIYAAIMFIPENDKPADTVPGNGANMEMEKEDEQAEPTQPTSSTSSTDETIAQGSHNACSTFDACEDQDELCYGGICQSKAEVETQDGVKYGDCDSLTCEGCETGQKKNMIYSSLNNTEFMFCSECNSVLDCKEGFSCKDFVCVSDE